MNFDDVRNALIKWKALLGLDDWIIEIVEDVNPVHCTGIGSDHTRNFMEITTRWQYMHATLRVDAQQLHNMPYDEADLDSHIVHELLHVILAESTDVPEVNDNDDHSKHEERVVTFLTIRIMELYERGNTNTNTTTNARTKGNSKPPIRTTGRRSAKAR